VESFANFIFGINLTKKNSMKKIILLGVLIASTASLSAQTAGKIYSGEHQGKAFQLGSEKSVQVILDAVKAYNSNDSDKELSFYSEDMQKKMTDYNHKTHAYAKSLNDVPSSILPLKVAGSTDEIVLLESVEAREAKNGSKQTLNLFEIFKVNKDGKISDFKQYSSIPATNEFGKTSGGKLITANPADENNGRSFQFSNRGEIAAIEKWVKAYNAMDVAGVSEVVADEIKMVDFDGNKSVLKKSDWPAYFAMYKSLDWKPNMILPFKITNTDPVSGIMVSSTEKRVLKDGSVWEKRIVEFFQFNLEGKINSVEQYGRPVVK
jgi:hypothetical protein